MDACSECNKQKICPHKCKVCKKPMCDKCKTKSNEEPIVWKGMCNICIWFEFT